MYDINTLLAFVSLFVASVAILFTYSQIRISRLHNKLSVRPKLQIGSYANDEDDAITAWYTLSNGGIGPATFDRYELIFEDRVLDADNASEFLQVFDGIVRSFEPKANFYRMVLQRDFTMAASEKVELLKVVISKPSGKTRQQLREFVNKFDFIIHYRSAYDEKFWLQYRKEADLAQRRSRAA